MSLAVVFSKFRLPLAAEASPALITQKCICTKGKPREIGITEYEEVSPKLFGETLKNFIANWTTEPLSPTAKNREIALWGSFFACPRDLSHGTNAMCIQRASDLSVLHEAKIIGQGLSEDSDLSEKAFGFETYTQSMDQVTASFEKTAQDLKAVGLQTKDKVAVIVRSGLRPPQGHVCDTQKLFGLYLEENGPFFRFYSINPLAPKQFAFCPTLSQMSQIVNAGGFQIERNLFRGFGDASLAVIYSKKKKIGSWEELGAQIHRESFRK